MPAFERGRRAESGPRRRPARTTAKVARNEPAVIYPPTGVDGFAGAGLLCGPASHRDGEVFSPRVPGEHRCLRASRRAQAARKPRTGRALDGCADANLHGPAVSYTHLTLPTKR